MEEDFILSEESFSFDQDDCSVSSEESDYNPTFVTNVKNVHQVITEERKKLLINFVNDKGYSVAKAARKLGMRYSTAKTLYARSRKEGKPKKKTDKGGKSDNYKSKPSALKEKNVKNHKATHEEDGSAAVAGANKKAEIFDRMEPPATRKKVKGEQEKWKEGYTCRVRELPKILIQNLPPQPMTFNLKTEYKGENQAEFKSEIKTEETEVEDSNTLSSSQLATNNEKDMVSMKVVELQTHIAKIMQEKAAMESMIKSYLFQQNLFSAPLFPKHNYQPLVSQLPGHLGMELNLENCFNKQLAPNQRFFKVFPFSN